MHAAIAVKPDNNGMDLTKPDYDSTGNMAEP